MPNVHAHTYGMPCPARGCRWPAEIRRVRTQAERDADGQTWRAGGYVPGEPVKILLHPDECVLVVREGVGVMCVRADHDHTQPQQPPVDRSWIGMELAQPRRRWWHSYRREITRIRAESRRLLVRMYYDRLTRRNP